MSDHTTYQIMGGAGKSTTGLPQVKTTNLAAALYLFQRGHVLAKIGDMPAWPSGLKEITFTFEGAGCQENYRRFDEGGTRDNLLGLELLFNEIVAVLLDQKADQRGGSR